MAKLFLQTVNALIRCHILSSWYDLFILLLLICGTAGLDRLQSSGKFPCAVCRTGVGSNSIFCNGCKHWVHKKCSGLKRMKKDPDYRCTRCQGTARPLAGRPQKEVQVGPDKLLATSLSKHVGMCTALVCGAQCSMPARLGNWQSRTSSICSKMTGQWSDRSAMSGRKTLSPPGPMSNLHGLALRIWTSFWRRENSDGMDIWNAPMVQLRQPLTYRWMESVGLGGPKWHGSSWQRGIAESGSSWLSTLMLDVPGDLVWDLPCVQQASYLEGGPLMWMLPLYLHVNKKSDYDMMMIYDERDIRHQVTVIIKWWFKWAVLPGSPGPIINCSGLDPSSVHTFQHVRFCLPCQMKYIHTFTLEALSIFIRWHFHFFFLFYSVN